PPTANSASNTSMPPGGTLRPWRPGRVVAFAGSRRTFSAGPRRRRRKYTGKYSGANCRIAAVSRSFAIREPAAHRRKTPCAWSAPTRNGEMYVSVAPRRSMNTWDLQYPHRTRVVDTSKEMGAPHFGQSTVATASPYARGPHKSYASTGDVR